MEEIRKTDGTAFGNKGSLVIAIEQKGLQKDQYNMVEKDGGWVGISIEKDELPKKEKPKLFKCRVFRSNCDPDNRDMPISITPNTISQRKVFWPGEEVELNQMHINILKDSAEETRLPIPADSGIYASKDPIAVAKNFYPSMKAEINPMDNTICMISRVPNYIVELIT